MSEDRSASRIQYIDALRGFTMLLVVMSHVSVFGLGMLGSDSFRYSVIYTEFMLPLFFFVSGFVSYKADAVWTIGNAVALINKKIWVLVFSPFLFLLASVFTRNLDLVEALMNYQKSGYWFTFVLFEFFILYILLQFAIKAIAKLLGGAFLEDIILVFSGLVIYALTNWGFVMKYHLTEGVYGLIGVPCFIDFVFFVIGNRVRKYFAQFERLLDSKYFVAVCVCLFCWLNIIPETKVLSSMLWNFITSLMGVIIVFALFRQKQEHLSTNTKMGRIAQYVGRRTLDIYLIHYFFIFSGMGRCLPDFGEINSPFIEFVCSLCIAIIVLTACLGVSMVLRLSPLMSHYMFGTKMRSD